MAGSPAPAHPAAPTHPAAPAPLPVEQDARGIVDPAEMLRVVTLNRYPAGESLSGIVDRFWAVTWGLPGGSVRAQKVLTHPGANLSVGHGEADRQGRPGEVEAVLHGVARRITTRRLGGTGWTVAAMTLPGGLGALVPVPARTLTDRQLPLGVALGRPGAALIGDVLAAGDEAGGVAVLRACLERVVAAADPARVAAAREVATAAQVAETDRSVRRAGQLATALGVTTRTLQRLFAEHAGVSPTWVLRRYRLLDAAERARHGGRVSWAGLAVDLGYSDQAHLVRDFARHLGTTPGAYAARQPVADSAGTAGAVAVVVDAC